MTSVLAAAKELLHSNEVLHPKLFDNNQKLFPDVRQKLLDMANFLIKKRLDVLYGVKIVDIVIVGSAAGYMYRDGSDIDVKIFTETSNPTIKNLNHFCKYCCCQELAPENNNIFSFYLDGIYVDMSFGPIKYDNGGNYSILNDCWVTHPIKDNLSNRFKLNDIVKGYYEFRYRIENFIAQFDFSEGYPSKKNLAELSKMRSSFFAIKYNMGNDYERYIKQFLIYRLFVKRKDLKNLSILLSQLENDFFAHHDEE